MINNQTPRVIIKVLADYDYIYNGNYYYLKSCNRLRLPEACSGHTWDL